MSINNSAAQAASRVKNQPRLRFQRVRGTTSTRVLNSTTTFSDPNLETEGCLDYFITVAYFVSFLFILFLVIVNTYIAVILDNFMELFEQEKLGATNEDLESFYETWARFDPDATQFIPIEKLQNVYFFECIYS